MGSPRISVVVPSFRRPERLPRLVAAMEAQDLPAEEWELLIVDNGSGDETSDVLEKLAANTTVDLRPLRIEENRGSAPARNLGWRSARAPLVAFTDDDCVPDPHWLAAGLAWLERWPEVGVVQGRTEAPPGTRERLGDWTLWREIRSANPWFEGCNVFYRREPLVAGGGFAEDLGHYGEDTTAGWSVVAQGWKREYADDAVVVHDVEERGHDWHVRAGLLERNLVTVAARHPEFRRAAFWKPWAFRPQNAALVLAAAGAVAGLRWRPALAAVLPYVYLRRPITGHPRRWRQYREQVMVDAAQTVGHLQGSIRNRVIVL